MVRVFVREATRKVRLYTKIISAFSKNFRVLSQTDVKLATLRSKQ